MEIENTTIGHSLNDWKYTMSSYMWSSLFFCSYRLSVRIDKESRLSLIRCLIKRTFQHTLPTLPLQLKSRSQFYYFLNIFLRTVMTRELRTLQSFIDKWNWKVFFLLCMNFFLFSGISRKKELSILSTWGTQYYYMIRQISEWRKKNERRNRRKKSKNQNWSTVCWTYVCALLCVESVWSALKKKWVYAISLSLSPLLYNFNSSLHICSALKSFLWYMWITWNWIANCTIQLNQQNNHASRGRRSRGWRRGEKDFKFPT